MGSTSGFCHGALCQKLKYGKNNDNFSWTRNTLDMPLVIRMNPSSVKLQLEI